MKKAKTFEFFDEIYRFQWLLIIGGTTKDAIYHFCDRIGEKRWDYEGNSDGHFASIRPHKCGLLWFKDKEILTSSAAHECFHGTMYLFETLTMKGPIEETEEVFAYYLQWLVNMINRLSLSKR